MNKFKFVIFVIILSFVFFKVLMALPKDQIASSKTIKMPVPIMKQIKEDYPKKISRFQASEIFCLAKNIYFEARNQSTFAKKAIDYVTLNRVQHRTFPNTICKVVKQGKVYPWKRNVPIKHKCQFSWYCDVKSDIPKERKAWNKSYDLAVNMYFNKSYDNTRGSTHYHTDYVKPYWRTDKRLEYVTKIGSHLFYRYRTNK